MTDEPMVPRVWAMRAGSPTPPPGAVRVDRQTKWGNPFVVGKDGDREQCIKRYRALLDGNVLLRQEIRRELAGKDLPGIHESPQAYRARQSRRSSEQAKLVEVGGKR